MLAWDFKVLRIRAITDKVLILKKKSKHDEYRHGLLQWFIIFFIKSALGGTVKIAPNKELVE